MLTLLIIVLVLALAAWVINTQFALPPVVRIIANVVLLIVLLVIVLRAAGVNLG